MHSGCILSTAATAPASSHLCLHLSTLLSTAAMALTCACMPSLHGKRLGRCADCSKTPRILVPCDADVHEGRQTPCANVNVGRALPARGSQAASESAATSSCCPRSPACKCQLCRLKGSGQGRQDQDLWLGIELLSIWSGSLRLLSAILGEPGVVSSWAEGGTSGCIVHREHA